MDKGVIREISKAMALGILSGVLYAGLFPPLELSWLAWITLVLLLLYLKRTGPVYGLLAMLLFGFTMSALHVSWLLTVPGFPFAGFNSIHLLTSLYYGLFGLFYILIEKRTNLPDFITIPTLWVAVEFLRSNSGFMALPWGLMGFTQYSNLPMIQIASVTSVYGISFVIVLVNVFVSRLATSIFNKPKIPENIKINRILAFNITFALTPILLLFAWGSYTVSSVETGEGGLLKASLVQGNILQEKKWDPRYKEEIIETYRDLTLKAANDHPDIIIWPESATPGYLPTDNRLRSIAFDLARNTGVPILLGSAAHAKVIRGENRGTMLKNGVFMIDREGKIIQDHYKIRLLPFGEYLPYEKKIPWPAWMVPKNGLFLPGDRFTTFQVKDTTFGAVICWESLFSGLVRNFVQSGARFMVNLNNEAWFGDTAASSQFLSMAVFRTVENRRPMLRAANTGISAYIDATGRIAEKVTDEEGNDTFVRGILTVQVDTRDEKTFYTKYGDVFAISATLLAIAFCVVSLLPAQWRNSLPSLGGAGDG